MLHRERVVELILFIISYHQVIVKLIDLMKSPAQMSSTGMGFVQFGPFALCVCMLKKRINHRCAHTCFLYPL